MTNVANKLYIDVDRDALTATELAFIITSPIVKDIIRAVIE